MISRHRAAEASQPLPGRIDRLLTGSGPESASGGGVRQGFIWTSLGNALVQAIQFAALLVLARLLSPSVFGLAAVVAVVIAFAQLLTDLGLASALIQLRTLSSTDIASAFWVNMATGALLTVFTWTLSGPIADAFGRPEVQGLIKLASLTFTVSCGVVQLAILERALKFRLVIQVEVLASLIGYAVAIVMAHRGAGAYALIAAPLITVGATSVILWAILPFNPFIRLSVASLHSLWERGAGVAGYNVVTFLARNSDNVLLARFASAADLGFYSRAYNIMMAPISQVNTALGRVLFPSLSRLRDKPELMAREYLAALRVAAALMFPATILIAALARTFSILLLGHEWAPMAMPLMFLCASGPAQVVAGTAGSVYQACNQGTALLRRGSLLAFASVAAICAGIPWGGTGIAAALLVRFYVLLPYSMSRPLRMTSLTYRELFRGLRGITIATATLAAVAIVIDRSAGQGKLWVFCVAVVAAFCAYVLVLALLDRPLVSGLANNARQRVLGLRRATAAR